MNRTRSLARMAAFGSAMILASATFAFGGGHMGGISGGGHMGGAAIGGMHAGGAAHVGGLGDHAGAAGFGGARHGSGRGFARGLAAGAALGALGGYGLGYGGFGGVDPGVEYGYGDDATVQTGRSAASIGNSCTTPVESCALGDASYIGTPCTCQEPDGSSDGRVTP